MQVILIDWNKYNDLLAQAGQLDTPEKSLKFVEAMRSAYGFDHFFFASYDEDQEVLLRVAGTYPERWSRLYEEIEGREKVDPVLRYLKRNKPFLWSDMDDLSEAEATLMNKSYALGIGPNGITLPIRSSDGRMSLLSATQKDISPEDWFKKVSILKKDLNEIASILHAALLTRIGINPPSVSLSSRAIECLKLKGCGMNEEQIARTLKISSNSAKKHLRSARDRLGARNYEQAIAYALQLSVIPKPGLDAVQNVQ